MEKCGNGAFFVEAVLGGEIERIDAAQRMIGCVANRLFDRSDTAGLGRLPQHAEECLAFAHRLLPRPRDRVQAK